MAKFITDWSQHHLLLTGAQGGLGQALAEQLTQRGAKLTLVGRNAEALMKQANQLQQQVLVLDLNAEDASARVLTYATSASASKTPVTGIIHNAGLNELALFNASDWQLHAQIMQLNALVPMQLSHSLLPLISRQPQSILAFVGSSFDAIGYPGQTSYCASKAAIARFAEALHRELQDTSTGVFYTAPRAIETPMNQGLMAQANEMLGNQVDSPNRVAHAIVCQLEDGQRRQALGWPEKFFIKLNALLPSVVDRAMRKPLTVISSLVRGHS